MNTKIVLLLIVLIAAAFRLYGIEDKNTWFDEIYSWKISQGSISQIVIETSGDIHPPFYYIVLKYWTLFFSDSIFSMRLLSAFLSILSLLLLYKLAGKFLSSKTQIILVLLLFAVSPLNIFYSQEIRMLNLNLFLCLGSVYYFFKFNETGNPKNGFYYILFTLLAIYTHYFAFLIFYTQFLIILIKYFFYGKNKKILFDYFKCFAIINIFYIPWYPVFFNQVFKGQPWRNQQQLTGVGHSLLDFFKDIFLSSYYSFENGAVILYATVFSVFISFFLIFFVIRALKDNSFFSDKVNPVNLFFFIPLFIALIISYKQSILLSRYLSIVLPYLFIIIVYFSFKYFKPRIALLFNIILIITSCFGAYINFNNHFKNNDYRKIISYLEKNFREGDVIIAEPHFMGWSIDYYVKHNETNIKKPVILGWDLTQQIDSLKNLNYFKNVWVILDYSALNKKNYDTLFYLMQDMGYQQSDKKTFYIIPSKVNVEFYNKSVN